MAWFVYVRLNNSETARFPCIDIVGWLLLDVPSTFRRIIHVPWSHCFICMAAYFGLILPFCSLKIVDGSYIIFLVFRRKRLSWPWRQHLRMSVWIYIGTSSIIRVYFKSTQKYCIMLPIKVSYLKTAFFSTLCLSLNWSTLCECFISALSLASKLLINHPMLTLFIIAILAGEAGMWNISMVSHPLSYRGILAFISWYRVISVRNTTSVSCTCKGFFVIKASVVKSVLVRQIAFLVFSTATVTSVVWIQAVDVFILCVALLSAVSLGMPWRWHFRLFLSQTTYQHSSFVRSIFGRIWLFWW